MRLIDKASVPIFVVAGGLVYDFGYRTRGLFNVVIGILLLAVGLWLMFK